MNGSFRNLNKSFRKFVSNEQWDEWMQSAETQEQDPATWLPTPAARMYAESTADGEMELTKIGHDNSSRNASAEYGGAAINPSSSSYWQLQWKKAWGFVRDGGTTFDGFLLAASAEVGQSILTLPYIFSLVGFFWGVVLEIGFATLALYTNYLLVSMHAQFRHNLKEKDDPRHRDVYYIVSYHEIMEGLVGPWLKRFSLVVVFFALLGLSTVQIIATSSNFYILNNSFSKRDWSFIWGGIFMFVAFIPTFRHYRVLSVLGILTTTYTSWYMLVAALAQGPIDDVVYDAPQTTEQFFRGFVSLLFIYGGHTSNIEVADVMDDPGSYDKSYFWSYLYVFSLTMPNAVAAYRTYGNLARDNANSFALFEPSLARDVAIVLMSLHQMVAFGLFVGPLFHMWEKLIHVHNQRFIVRAILRIPLALVILFLAVAFPFFGAINSVLGAFTTSFGTYIIPLVAYNLAFSSSTNMVKQPVMNLDTIKIINWILAAFVLIAGVGLGGYNALRNFIAQIEHFDYFADCYQCPEE